MRKIISLSLIFLIFAVILPALYAAPVLAAPPPLSYRTMLRTGFDNLGGWNNGGTGTYSNPDGAGTIYSDWKSNITFSSEDAPKSVEKSENSNYGAGETDKALKIAFSTADGAGSGNNYNFNNSFSNVNMYGIVKISVNIYVERVGSGTHAMFQADLRNSGNGSSYCNLFSVRQNGTIQIIHTNTSTNKTLSAAVGSWVNLTFVIDTAAKTYTFFKDGVKDNELTDKPLAMNMALYFEGDPSPNGLLCNQLRFSSGVTGSNIAKNSVLYLDDIDFTTGKTAVNPTFIKTVHSSGIDNNDFDNVPKDLTSFVVDLGCDVDPSSLNGRVSLTKSGGVTPDVAFSGAYFERKYTVTLITPAAPYTGYTVTFDEGVTAVGSFAGFVLGEAVTLTFTTEKAPFVITDMYFSEEPSAGGIISEIPVNAGTVYGNVNIIYDETLASSQDVTVFVTVYADKGEAGLLMKNVYFYKTTILPPVGKTYDTLEIPVNLSGVTLGGSSKIGIFARDNLTGMLPLSDTYFVNVKYS